ncbi:CLUMA_CG011694, isoform A [Clunio marinus]|uniref:CLUMA_CG011694, isoform A n=1 Tax=Clunio marinus TaxID=568069 RepID=A0A1J1IFL0_9DIPT|nr:CLUMA_CG011694, isoform A [Clunio marinus]
MRNPHKLSTLNPRNENNRERTKLKQPKFNTIIRLMPFFNVKFFHNRTQKMIYAIARVNHIISLTILHVQCHVCIFRGYSSNTCQNFGSCHQNMS